MVHLLDSKIRIDDCRTFKLYTKLKCVVDSYVIDLIPNEHFSSV